MNTIATQFVRARLEGRALAAYPGSVPETLQAAYAVQDAAIGLWLEKLGQDRLAGWKVARVAPNWPPAWGATPPEPRLIGPAFARNIHFGRDGVIPACPVFENGFAAVETEVVIRVGKDAPADKLQWSIDEALSYIGDVHMGIEVASSPLASLNDLGGGAVVSDFGNNWGIVVGESIPRWRELRSIDCVTFVDGVEVGAKAVDMHNGPFDALAFTLGKCAERGRPLRAGMWITTGMITGVHNIRIGQVSRHVFSGIGEVGCRITRAVPSPAVYEEPV